MNEKPAPVPPGAIIHAQTVQPEAEFRLQTASASVDNVKDKPVQVEFLKDAQSELPAVSAGEMITAVEVGFKLPPEPIEQNLGLSTASCGGEFGKGTKQSLSQKDFLMVAAATAELWHDAEGDAFATVKWPTRTLSAKVRSKDFKSWLCWRVYSDFGCTPSSQALEEAIRILEGRAKFDCPQFCTHFRIAGDSEITYLHLGDDAGTIYGIDSSDVRDASDASIRFLSKPGMRALPNPKVPASLNEAKECLGELRRFCNLEDDADWLLFLVCLLSAFRPIGPFVVVIFLGEQGCAKSTICRLFRRLVDPSSAPLRSAPREERDLWVAANNGWILAFDNVSRISADLSDAICRLATGGGNSYRELYTDDGEKLFQAQRLVLLNTIDDLPLRGDLVDRAIQLSLKKIEDTARKSENAFWEAFSENESGFLGALLLVLSRTLKELPGIELVSSPRMADFARFGVAVERALALPPNSFLASYGENRRALSAIALDSQFTQLFLSLDLPFHGTATELWEMLQLRVHFANDKPPRWFPSNPQQLASRLRRLAPYFRQQDLEISFSRKGSRVISITEVGHRNVEF